MAHAFYWGEVISVGFRWRIDRDGGAKTKGRLAMRRTWAEHFRLPLSIASHSSAVYQVWVPGAGDHT